MKKDLRSEVVRSAKEKKLFFSVVEDMELTQKELKSLIELYKNERDFQKYCDEQLRDAA